MPRTDYADAFATIPEAGHWVHAEAPERFLAVLEPFLVA